MFSEVPVGTVKCGAWFDYNHLGDRGNHPRGPTTTGIVFQWQLSTTARASIRALIT
jgi:hypothetical protein